MAVKKATPTKKSSTKKETVAKKETVPAPPTPQNKGVEQDILEVTGAKTQSKKESEQDYLQRLAEAIDEKDEFWDKLGKPAQDWFTAAVGASDTNSPLPSLNADTKELEPKIKPATPAKKAATTKGEEKKRNNGSGRVVEMVVADLSADIDLVLAQAKKEGVAVAESQVRNVFSMTHRFFKVFQEAGLIKK